jgi:DNA ligase D-like protein (predicted 3'-phosphoesterase)
MIAKFVVHKHQARKLHFDFRLELDGVLKSWAIPKELPLKEGIKRLAIQVEDHPLSYLDFAGIIPKGIYGAGDVQIWDKGKYELKERTSNKLKFELYGEKIRGNYCLLMFKKEGQKTSWLFFKTLN